jgi:tRNA G37 N-methylase TrmD
MLVLSDALIRLIWCALSDETSALTDSFCDVGFLSGIQSIHDLLITDENLK